MTKCADKLTNRPDWWEFEEIVSSLTVRVEVASRIMVQDDLAVTFPEDPGHVRFEFVEAGQYWIHVEGLPWRKVKAGDWVLLPSGDPFTLSTAPAHPSITIEEFTSALQMPCRSGLNYVWGHGPLQASAISGFAVASQWRTHPIWRSLPPVIVLPTSQAPGLETLLMQVAREASDPMPGSRAIVDRLVEVAVMYAVRHHIQESGVLAASLFDPPVHRALAAFHAAPDEPWTLDRLAEVACVSRSTFAERFTRVMNMAPGEYVTAWRMHRAAELLREHRVTVGEAAVAVGYGSEAAFARAFRCEVGRSPGELRREAATR